MQLRVVGLLVVLVVLGGLLDVRAASATEQDLFSRRVGKSAAEYSTDLFARPKLACVCMSSTITGLASAAGVLRRGPVTVGGATRIRVDCWVPSFDAAGNRVGASACYDFVVLPK